MRLSSTQLEGSAERSAPSPSRSGDEDARRARRAEAGPLAELLELFEWHPEPAGRRSRAAIERHHLEAVAGRVNSRLPSRVLVELEALPDDAYLTMLRAPDLYHAAFHRPHDQLAAALQRWIAVERARQGAPTTLDGEVRSASRDRRILASAGQVLAIEPVPRLAAPPADDGAGHEGGPLLDTDRELAARFAPRGERAGHEPPSPQELALVATKLEHACQLLAQACPPAYQLTHAMIQVVCPSSAAEDPHVTAASAPGTLGVVHLVNAHLSRKHAAELATELTREAVRQALLRWELRYPLFDDARLAALKVRSPWTGAALDLHGYIHACFAWYGVAQLWRQTSMAYDRGELAAVRQRRAAEAGFAQRPLERLGKHAFSLAPELQAALEVMTEAVAPV